MMESEQSDRFGLGERGSERQIAIAGESADGSAGLERQLERLRLAISNLSDYAIIGIDQQHLISSWSDGAQQMLGWEEQEILGRPAAVFFTAEDIANGEPNREFQAAMQQQSIEEERWHVRKDGDRFWGSGTLSIMHDSSGSVHGFVKVMRDLTARKRAEEQLRDSEERFRLFVENVTDYALVQVDPERNISGWNTGAERSFGYTEDEIIGQPMTVLFTPGDVARGDPDRDFDEALTAGRAEYERWLVRKDGSRFWARWVTTPMYDEAGRLLGYAKVLHDETQRKDAQDQQRKALEEKNALLQEVHHRVKNNLQVISSLLSLQAERLNNPQTLAVLEDTQSRVAAIAAIHEQLYASKDLSSIEFSPYLQRLVRGLFGLHGARKDRITLNVEAADVVLNVQQAMPLGLIVNELVINALKHAFPQNRSGAISVSLSFARANGAGEDQVQEDLVRLKVQDNGVGLPPGKDISQVQSMGFNLVHLLVQQLHGKLEANSGSGLAVIVTFSPK
ncbi:MAG: sensor histidine kinase [Bryobacteraceae bacterium]